AAGDTLGGRDQVGHDAFVLAREPVAGAAEAGLDLVGDEDDSVLTAEIGQSRQETVGWDDEPAFALHWFDHHGRDTALADLGVNEAGNHVERLGRAAGR